jgi:hypothetical protein
MNWNSPHRWIAACAALLGLFLAAPAEAQLQSFSKQGLIDYTAENPFDRLPDGRPKVPDQLLERARDLSAEDIWATLEEKGYNNQYADGFSSRTRGKPWQGARSRFSSCRCGRTWTTCSRPRPKRGASNV